MYMSFLSQEWAFSPIFIALQRVKKSSRLRWYGSKLYAGLLRHLYTRFLNEFSLAWRCRGGLDEGEGGGCAISASRRIFPVLMSVAQVESRVNIWATRRSASYFVAISYAAVVFGTYTRQPTNTHTTRHPNPHLRHWPGKQAHSKGP